TRRKSLGRKRLTKPESTFQELDLDAAAETFIKVIADEDSEDKAPLLWSALVEGNASLSKTLLGDNVSEDNFLARMAALIKRKKQALAEKLAKERRNRWSMAYVKSFTDAQLKEEFKKIQKAPSNIQIQAFNRTLKRTGL
nr:hypothetical protein [Tanacetum cinerariifolium]